MEEKTKSCKNCIHLGIEETFTDAQKESICTRLVCTVDPTYSTRFVLCNRHELLQSEKTIPYEIKIDSSGLGVMLKNFAVTLEANFNPEKIQHNAIAAREIDELVLELSENGYDKKYHTWDNWKENFMSYSLKSESWIGSIRQTINGMINEIKRLEKDNEELKGKIIFDVDFLGWMDGEANILPKIKDDQEARIVYIDRNFYFFKNMTDLYNIWNNLIRPKTK